MLAVLHITVAIQNVSKGYSRDLAIVSECFDTLWQFFSRVWVTVLKCHANQLFCQRVANVSEKFVGEPLELMPVGITYSLENAMVQPH